MEMFAVIGQIAAIITIFLAVVFFINWARGSSRFRRIYYYLINKEFKANVQSIKRYPDFKIDFNKLRRGLVEHLKKKGKRVTHLCSGKNNVEILIEGMQAPYLISQEPYVDISSTEKDIENTEPQVLVKIQLLGTVEFRYREDEENKVYLDSMEDFFSFIERENKVTSNYSDFNLLLSFGDFSERLNSARVEEMNGATLYYGDRLVNIHSSSLSPLYSLYRKSITEINCLA